MFKFQLHGLCRFLRIRFISVSLLYRMTQPESSLRFLYISSRKLSDADGDTFLGAIEHTSCCFEQSQPEDFAIRRYVISIFKYPFYND